jgi:hypothetical protein
VGSLFSELSKELGLNSFFLINRQVKESVLSFVDIFLQRDELEEDVEDSIISLVQILLSEYFSKRHDEMPPSFQQLSLHVVKK